MVVAARILDHYRIVWISKRRSRAWSEDAISFLDVLVKEKKKK
jgi:hypothetical protein